MIDERAARGFAGAEHYDAHRPSYPPAAVAFIREAGRLDKDSTVVELGAGTGLMTRLLPPVGRLIAVEPLPEMRSVLRTRVPESEVLDGSAEDIPLPSGVADAVVVAQAFHWFANSQAVHEIARVLKPDGVLILVWNSKDPLDPMMAGIDEALATCRLNSPGFDHTPWREVFADERSPLRLSTHETFSFEEPLTLRQLKGRTLSASYIALLEQDLQAPVLHELERLAGSAADDTSIVMKYRTEVFVAKRR